MLWRQKLLWVLSEVMRTLLRMSDLWKLKLLGCAEKSHCYVFGIHGAMKLSGKELGLMGNLSLHTRNCRH